MGLIYLLTFANGKKYIGQTYRDVKQRLRQHRYHAVSSKAKKDKNIALYAAWRKYGEPTLLILDNEVPDPQLDQFEIEMIAVLETQVPNGYNIRLGGSNSPHSIETNKRISEKRRGIKFSPSHIEALRKSHLGKTQSPETRMKKSESVKLSWQSNTHKRKIRNQHLRAARTIAESQKLPLYSTGRPCKNGHVSSRRTSTGGCVECSKLRQRRLHNRSNNSSENSKDGLL